MSNPFVKLDQRWFSVFGELTGNELKMLIAVNAMSFGKGRTYASVPTLAGVAKLSRTAAFEALAGLRKKKHVTREGRDLVLRVPETGTEEIIPPVPETRTPESGKPGPPSPENPGPGVPETRTQTDDQVDERSDEKEDEPVQAELLKEPHPRSRGEVRRLFEVWQDIHGHPRAKLDQKRRDAIAKGIKLLGEAGAEAAIRGAKLSDFHMGGNDSGTIYDGLHVIFKHADNAEKFRRLHEQASQVPAADMRKRWNEILDEIAPRVHDLDRRGVPVHEDTYLNMMANAVVASTEASVRLVKELGSQAAEVARYHVDGARDDYREEMRRAGNAKRANTERDPKGGGPLGHSENGQGVVG